ncbi:hypothetical protein L1049_000664 [Liquidambar formosana]|uniref:DDRGK domain-containing protein 1 n=1 Tax=Liquidambar formosana TaxID=63359 RepID=A0AAP0NCR9_LIQFO
MVEGWDELCVHGANVIMIKEESPSRSHMHLVQIYNSNPNPNPNPNMAMEISHFEPQHKSGYGTSKLQESNDLKGPGFATTLCEFCSGCARELTAVLDVRRRPPLTELWFSISRSPALSLEAHPHVTLPAKNSKMEDILVAMLSMLLILALIPLYLWKRRMDSRLSDQHDEEPQVPQREAVVRATGTRATGTRRMRRRPASGASTSSAQAATVEETADGSDEEADVGEYHDDRVLNKREKKRQEREAQRQAEEAARESRHSKQDRYAEMRRRKDEEHEARERMLVDAEGTTENEVQDGSQGLLFDFVEYIKKHKCVPLEDLAAEFKLRTQECINRITSLESMGRLSGVMDDRGKYIYISQEEMKAVADYIKREGRVSISHLASKSNQFIDLEPKSQFVEEISNVEEISVA